MMTLLLIWGALLACLMTFAVGRARHEGVLTLSYFLSLSLIHVPGVLAFLDTTYVSDLNADFVPTQLGFEVTLIGMAAFVAGASFARGARPVPKSFDGRDQKGVAQELQKISWRAVSIGGLTYVVLIPVADYIPSLTALVSPLAALLVVGLWLRLYGAIGQDRKNEIVRSLVFLPLLPLTSLVSQGFLGFGVSWALSALMFLFVFARRRIFYYLVAPLVVLIGLSVFVTYMGQRGEIRKVVWISQGSLAERLEKISTIATEFHILDLSSLRDREALEERLNQNLLVGIGVRNHQDGMSDLYYGATVPWWALIPRAVWPDKPSIGGGGALVTSFTRVVFARGTSVGVGQVLEFYMNFAYVGIVLGFAGVGYLLMRIDQEMMRALTAGNLRRFLLFALPGLTLLQPGGNLLEIIVGAISAFIITHLLMHFEVFKPLTSWQQKRPRETIVRPQEIPALRHK